MNVSRVLMAAEVFDLAQTLKALCPRCGSGDVPRNEMCQPCDTALTTIDIFVEQIEKDSKLGRLLRAIREAGWSVGVHNDYKLSGGDDDPKVRAYTFWLFTHPDGRYLKGEAETDTEALDQIAAAIAMRDE